MKILVISDVHGNLEALNTVLKVPHDAVIFAGDVVDYGPRPAECIDKIKEVAFKTVRGNHDNAVAFNTDCGCSYEMHELSVVSREYTKKVVSKEQVKLLQALPLKEQFRIEGKTFFLVHASNSNPLFKYLRPNIGKEEFKKEFGHINADFIIYGHTHIPVVFKDVSRGIIINPGSVGQPRDGDPRTSCAVIDTKTNEVHIKRIVYDIDRVKKQIKEANLPMPLITILENGYH